MTRGGGQAQATPITVQATSGPVKQTVSASGTIDAAKSADLDFAVSGTVTRVYVAEGDKVHKGQALARVDDDALVATRDADAATLNAAEEQLSDDEDSGASDVQIASDRSAVVSARSTLAEARQNVKDAVLRSTINGTVAAFDLSVGDVVSGSGSSNSDNRSNNSNSSNSNAADSSSSSAVTVVSTHHFILDGTVSADDVTSIKKGMEATIDVSGSSDPIYGTVKSVGLVASTSSSGAAVFPVTIDVTGAQKGLYAGTSATASITVKQRPNVLTVASAAIRSSGTTTYVMKMVDGKPVKTPVTIGEVYGTTTEVTKGLKAGDTVQLPGFSVRRSGSGGGDGRSGGGGGFQPPDGGKFSGSGGFSGRDFPGGGS